MRRIAFNTLPANLEQCNFQLLFTNIYDMISISINCFLYNAIRLLIRLDQIIILNIIFYRIPSNRYLNFRKKLAKQNIDISEYSQTELQYREFGSHDGFNFQPEHEHAQHQIALQLKKEKKENMFLATLFEPSLIRHFYLVAKTNDKGTQ